MYLSQFKVYLQQLLRYLADKGKCPNLQGAITQEILIRTYSKVNQIMSSYYQSSSFKALVTTVFADKVKIPEIAKGHK